MNRRRSLGPGATGSLVALLVGVSCGGGAVAPEADDREDQESVVATLVLTPSRIELQPGQDRRLSATARNGRGDLVEVGSEIVWSSSAPGIASVTEGGRVTGVGPGEAEITARIGTVSAKADVVVVQPTNLPLEVVSSLLPDGVVGEPYEAFLQASGGNGVYEWVVVPGSALPPGLEIDGEAGLISGVPEEDGNFQTLFEVRSNGQAVVGLVLTYFADLSGRSGDL